jgi:hypothetical protein
MRKKREKYKVCQRLGYNAGLRRWSGTKKKWQNHVRSGGVGEERNEPSMKNPVTILTNEKRIGSSRKGKNRIRRKDIHGLIQEQKTGRKRRYGGVRIDGMMKKVAQEIQAYKETKKRNEQRYRKGRKTSREQTQEVHRRAKTEVRADVRRWRSGRVSTIERSRDRIEHGGVYRTKREEGELRTEVLEWYGYERKRGEGRKVKEEIWKKIKKLSRELVQKKEYRKTGVRYLQVDYVTGRRLLVRMPRSGDVVIPEGMERTVVEG